jgi:PAS domain S-box-containing protein
MRNVKNISQGEKIIPTERTNPDYILYKTILETSMDGFWMTDINGNIMEVNNAYCNLTGYSRSELLSMNVADVEVQESPAEVKKHIKLLNRTGSHRFITKQRCKNGKIIELEVSANSLKHYHFRTFAFFRDITEFKKQEELLQNERDTAQKYLDISGVIFIAINNKGNITLINKKGCEILDWKEEEIINKNWFETFIPERLREEIKVVFKTLMKSQIEPTEYFENPVITKSGEERLIAWHNMTLTNEKKEITGTLSSGIDITEHRKAEIELQKAKQDWENIFQSIGQPSFILDPERRIIAANRATVTMTGIPAEQLIGKKCYEIFHKKNSHPEECLLEKVLSSGCFETKEMEIELFGGIYLVSCTPVFNDQGILEKVIHIATDITDRKKAEKKIYEYQKQLKQMDSEILLAEEKERHRIAAGIHDDIGQRLAIIKFGLDSLQATESRADVLSSLERQTELISHTIEDVRSFTFELSNPILYEIGVEAAIEAWMIDHIQNKCGIKCKLITKGPNIYMTEEVRIILFQGVRELLTNIIKHAKADYVEVNIIRSDKNIQIFVEDNGIGLNASQALKRKKTKKGFGLFNLRERLDYLGGTLEIQNISPKGTVAIIHVPLKQEEIITGRLLP